MRALLKVACEQDENSLEFESYEKCAKGQADRFSHRTANGWLSSAIAHLRRQSRSARGRRQHGDAQIFGFAAHMLMDLKRYGRPGLYVGMFYDDEWEWIGYGSEREANAK